MKRFKDSDFRNYMAGDPFLQYHAGVKPAGKRNFCACGGLNATGGVDAEIPDTEEDLKTKVNKMTAWRYVRTALAIIGVIVVAKFVYTKYIR